MSTRFMGYGSSSWNEQQFNPYNPYESSLGLTKEDIEYSKISKKKNSELFQNMGTRQKRLLMALE